MIGHRFPKPNKLTKEDIIIKNREQCRVLTTKELEFERYLYGNNYYEYLTRFINVPSFSLDEERQFLLQEEVLEDFTEQIANILSPMFITYKDYVKAIPKVTSDDLSNYSINDYRLKVIYYFHFLDIDNFISCITADYKLLGKDIFNKFLVSLEPKMIQKLEEVIRETNSTYRKSIV